ncbi:MAG: hypothetical protein HPY53_14250 [Brevinematales bacterium]|nr:hypothetical protein [Brevinematales bacterium]
MKSINTAAILLVLTVVPLSGVALKTNSMYHPDKKKNCIIGCNPESAFFAQALNISNMSFIMLDAYGRMYGPFGSNSHTAISPDCTGYAYTKSADGKDSVYVDGEKLASYDEVKFLKFLPDNTEPSFVFEENGKEYLYYKGMSIGGFDEITGLALAGDSKSYGLIYRTHRSYYVHTGFTNAGPYLNCKELKMSYNGHSCVFIAKTTNTTYPGASKDAETSISADGSMKGICYLKENLYYVRVNDTEYGPYEFASAPIFGNAPGEFAFYYVNSGGSFIRYGEQVIGPYDFAYNFIFLPGNPGFAYIAQSGGNYFIRLGETEVLGPYRYADIRLIGGKLHLLIGANGSFYFCEMK